MEKGTESIIVATVLTVIVVVSFVFYNRSRYFWVHTNKNKKVPSLTADGYQLAYVTEEERADLEEAKGRPGSPHIHNGENLGIKRYELMAETV